MKLVNFYNKIRQILANLKIKQVKKTMEAEKKMFADGIRVMKVLINDASDMDYYFRMYGKIENYLFPSLRVILVNTAPNYTDYQLEFIGEFKKLVHSKGYVKYDKYFDTIPTSNSWLTDLDLH